MSTGFQEEALPSKLNFSVWGKILRYATKHGWLLVLSLVATLFATFYDSSFTPVMNAAAIEIADGIGQGAYLGLSLWEIPVNVTFIFGIEAHLNFVTYLILLGAFIIVRSFAIFGSFYSLNIISMHVVIDLRRDTFRRIQELSFSYFDKTSSGWLIARMQGDTYTLSNTLVWGLNSLLWCFSEIIFSLATMFSVDWRFSLIILASLPPVAVMSFFFEMKVLKKHRIARNAHSQFVGYLAETISGAKTIKSMALESARKHESEEITGDLCEKRYRAHLVNAFFNPLLSLVSGLMITLVVFYGNAEIAKGAVTAATVVLFLTFVRNIYDPLSGLAENMSEFMAAQASAEKVVQLLEAKPEIVDRPEVIAKYGTLLEPKTEAYEPFHGAISFRDVRFDYGNGIEVIHPLNLEIEAGSSIAIVGETGSGKTTLVNLLCRFYEPTGGHILIDGIDYLDRSLGYLRSNIGYVQQTPFVFKGTYFDNIAYGKEGATLDEVKAVAKAVGIDGFIEEKGGYQTMLDLGGDALSQGQKQLIAFARALLRNPTFLILDEATSSIDALTEAKLQKTVNGIMKGRTSILIAHRLSTVVSCDRILFMEGGFILEDGSHRELMAKKGKYYELFMSQFEELTIDTQLEIAKNAEGR
ncbi:MAG: ABC transporter ATP-binding protein [Candidatus Enteromonas sp.]